MKIGYAWQYSGWQEAPPTATTLHVRAVVDRLKSHGHQVRMVTLFGGKPRYSDDLSTWQPVETRKAGSKGFRLLERGVRGVQSRLGLPYLNYFESQKFAAACAAAFAGYDLIYERFWLSAYGGLLAGRKLGVPVFYEVNGDLVSEYQQLGIHLSRAQWKALHWITRRMFLGASRVVAVTEPLREITTQRWHLPANKVTTIYNGANVELFSQVVDGQGIREEYHLGEAPVIMFVGSFQPWHGLDLLVEAFCLLAQRDPEVKLVLVGDGQTRAELQGQVRSLGLDDRVVFTGPVAHEAIARFLAAAQVTVVNPRQSPAAMMGSPLKLFEYMAAGKAIVAPQLPNIQRILEDRETALLVTPNDAQALASAMGELIADQALRGRLGEAARSRALSEHSWEQTVHKLEGVFSAALEQAG